MDKMSTTSKVICNCPQCNDEFTLEQLFNDPDLVALGVCFLIDAPQSNCYFFNHDVEGCRTTITVPVDNFRKFITEDIPEKINTGNSSCEKLCFKIDEDSPCNACCYFAPFRALLHQMRWVKREKATKPTA